MSTAIFFCKSAHHPFAELGGFSMFVHPAFHLLRGLGLRFLAPKTAIHAGPNPKYFGRGRGITCYNMLSDPYSGLGATVVPGTLRDSLAILALLQAKAACSDRPERNQPQDRSLTMSNPDIPQDHQAEVKPDMIQHAVLLIVICLIVIYVIVLLGLALTRAIPMGLPSVAWTSLVRIVATVPWTPGSGWV